MAETQTESRAETRERIIVGVSNVLRRLRGGESLYGDSATLHIAWRRAREIGVPIDEIKLEAERRLDEVKS